MFHFCHEELMALLMAIPVLKYGVTWLRAKFHRNKKCECVNAKGEESV